MLFYAGILYGVVAVVFARGLTELEWRGRLLKPISPLARLGVGLAWPLFLGKAVVDDYRAGLERRSR